jgi:hypothetical protein
MQDGNATISTYCLLEINVQRLGLNGKKDRRFLWRPRIADFAEGVSWHLDNAGLTYGRLVHANLAFLIEPNWRRFKHLVKSWLKVKATPHVDPSNKP